jgi:hypothetical protein
VIPFGRFKTIVDKVEVGRKLTEYRAGITARAFEASKQKLRPAK